MDNSISEESLYLINIIADIRMITGVNERPMLDELAKAIGTSIKENTDKAYQSGYIIGKYSENINKHDLEFLNSALELENNRKTWQSSDVYSNITGMDSQKYKRLRYTFIKLKRLKLISEVKIKGYFHQYKLTQEAKLVLDSKINKK